MIPVPTLTAAEAERWRPWLVSHNSADIIAWYHACAQVLPGNAVCVEVGVAHGRTVIYLAEILAALGRAAARVYAVDPWQYPIKDDTYPQFPAGFGQVLRGMTCSASDVELERIYPIRACSVRAARLFAAQTLDLVVIDADHSRRAVEEDIEAWGPLVKGGGWLSGHDYAADHMGVIDAVQAAFGPQVVVQGSVWAVQVPTGGL